MEDTLFTVVIVVAVFVLLFFRGDDKRGWGENPKDAKWGKKG